MVGRIVMWFGLAVMVLLVACGGDDADTTTEPPATTQAVTSSDPERGREIGDAGGGVLSLRCSSCHTLDGSEIKEGNRVLGPSGQGVYGRAGDRVPGLSAQDYLRQSIEDPAAFIVEGYSDFMPKGYRILLSGEDIDGLVAFLLTQ